MSLDNLVGISLEQIESDRGTIQRLLVAARRNIDDAGIAKLSSENRFDVAYKAIMQLANAALQANGYRTLTSKPGHHMTMIQSLGQTIGLEKDVIIVLDQLRKQRNVADYSGDIIPESATIECIDYARQLMQSVEKWLNKYRPDLVG